MGLPSAVLLAFVLHLRGRVRKSPSLSPFQFHCSFSSSTKNKPFSNIHVVKFVSNIGPLVGDSLCTHRASIVALFHYNAH